MGAPVLQAQGKSIEQSLVLVVSKLNIQPSLLTWKWQPAGRESGLESADRVSNALRRTGILISAFAYASQSALVINVNPVIPVHLPVTICTIALSGSDVNLHIHGVSLEHALPPVPCLTRVGL